MRPGKPSSDARMMLESLINIVTIDFIAELRVSFMSLVPFERRMRGSSGRVFLTRCSSDVPLREELRQRTRITVG